jgi:beta-lactamase regulating signal transducer with metallopeptidase domain
MSVVTTLLVNTIVFSVLVGFVLGLRKLLSGRISAVMQYALLAVITLKLVIPFGFESTISPLGWFDNRSALPETMQTEARQPGYDAQADTGLTSETEGETRLSAQASPAKSADSQTFQTGTTQTPQTAIRTAPLHWSVWVCIVWLAGVIVMALWLALGLWSIRRRIRHTRMKVPEHILAIFNACKKDLGIKRSVKLVMQTAIPVPSITGVFNPTLIVPDCLTDMVSPTLRSVFLHELTHYKHGDLWVTWIMNGLNCLYWFNPLVWLCFKLLRNDMETICDQRCLRLMDRNTQSGYVNTVLHFAGFPSNKRLQAAIAITNGRKNIEKRIRNMFKKRRTSGPAKILVTLVAAMMLVTCVLTACQPTPETPPVVHKEEDIPKEAILQTVTPSAEVETEPVSYIEPMTYSVNEHWAETARKNDLLSIEADADILMPEAAAYPVERLERVVLTQENVDELIAYFTEPGTKFYTGEDVKLKSEYEEELIRLKQELQKVLNGGDGETPESIQSYIEETERNLAKAPESYTYTYVEPAFTYMIDYETGEPRKEYGENFISVSIELPDGERQGSVSASRYEKGKNTGSGFTYFNFSGGWNTESYFTWYDEELRQEMEDPRYLEANDDEWKKDMTRQREFVDAGLKSMQGNNMDLRAAADKAVKLLEELGIEDMQLKSYEKAMFSRERSQEENYTIPGCYIEFVRECGGIPSLSQSGGSFSPEQDYSELYCAPFGLESVKMIISEDGVEYFSWRGMAQEVERVAENTTLMPFDQMKQCILNYIYFMNAEWLDHEQGEKRVKIEEMRLVTTYINAKDDPERVLIVPAWHVKAQEEYLFDQTDTWQEGNEEEFMINALDGSGILMPGILEQMQNRQG